MIKYFIPVTLLGLFILISLQSRAQQPGPFAGTRVINGHSTVMLWKGELDFRISHRFGDVGGTLGGADQFWGIDNARDIRIGFEYALNNKFMIGIARKKGVLPTGSKLEGFAKAALRTPDENERFPWWATILVSSNAALGTASENLEQPDAFTGLVDRLTYTTKLMLAVQMNERVSFQLAPTYLHRNFVFYRDKNDLFALDLATRLRVTKVLALILEATLIDTDRMLLPDLKATLPLSAGLEFDTGGHVFQLDITNASGLGENQYMAYTVSDWAEGQFRLGFTISRPFKIR